MPGGEQASENVTFAGSYASTASAVPVSAPALSVQIATASEAVDRRAAMSASMAIAAVAIGSFGAGSNYHAWEANHFCEAAAMCAAWMANASCCCRALAAKGCSVAEVVDCRAGAVTLGAGCRPCGAVAMTRGVGMANAAGGKRHAGGRVRGGGMEIAGVVAAIAANRALTRPAAAPQRLPRTRQRQMAPAVKCYLKSGCDR
mmetsp:Transcript_46117/g.121795  ORF Transcript_46117/g.121795 Transcript_46117/m.121795 type:complete len:202 (-) Transcript_46117:22-627(-)